MKIDAISTLTGTPAQQATPTFTDKEKRDELANECNRRKSEFPGQVRQGRMRQEHADRRRAIMHAIWLDYVAKTTSAQPTESETIVETPRRPQTVGVDHGAGDDMTTHRVIAGDGDGEIGRPVRPTIDQADTDMQPKYDAPASYPTGESTPAASSDADASSD